jgi:hypothetical protein
MLAVAVALDHFMETAATETLAAVEWGVMVAVLALNRAAVAALELEITELPKHLGMVRVVEVLLGLVTAKTEDRVLQEPAVVVMLLQLLDHQINLYLFSYTNKVLAAAAAVEPLVMRLARLVVAGAHRVEVMLPAAVVLAAGVEVYLVEDTVQVLMDPAGLAAVAVLVETLQIALAHREA